MSTFGTLPEVLRLVATESDHTVRQRFTAALLLVIAGALLAGLSPLALKGLIDAVTPASEGTPAAPGAALAYGIAYLLALCGGRLLTEVRPLLIEAGEQRLHRRLRQRFFSHLLEARLTFHLGKRTGALVHSLHQATAACQVLVSSLLNGIVPVLVEVATVTFVLARFATQGLVATFAVTALAYLAVFGLGTRRLGAHTLAVSKASLDTHATLVDSLLNYETIKCFNAEPATRERLDTASAALEQRWSQLRGQRTRIGLCAAATFTVSMAISLAIAADAVADGTLSIGGFVLVNVCVLQVVRPLEMLGAAARDVSQSLAFIGPLLAVLKEPRESPAGTLDGAALPSLHTPSVRFEGVHFAYEAGRPVLRGLDLDIAAGRSVAIVGDSGSGKSSLTRLLLRLCDPQSGRIWLDQAPIDTLDAGQVRAMVGLVPQDTALLDGSIADNIGMGRRGVARADIEHAARVAQLHDFIAALPAGYDTPVGERGLKLSGGERQRVAIARAVLKHPRLYVFDEATSMLDSATEAGLLRQLREISAGCTTITIAHRLSTARHADEIVVLANGTVVERGTHASLLASGAAYARLWHSQIHSGPE